MLAPKKLADMPVCPWMMMVGGGVVRDVGSFFNGVVKRQRRTRWPRDVAVSRFVR
jgi:hypothetical protein